MLRPNVDFMGNRNIMFMFSGALVLVAIAALLLRGLTFGVEFRGGTVVDISQAGSVTQAQMTKAVQDAGLKHAVVQEITTAPRGFIIRSSETSAVAATAAMRSASKAVGLTDDTLNVTTIGPDWGKNITSSAMLALIVSLFAILLYVSLRFEYKMSVMAIVALVHDIVITLGLYALVGLGGVAERRGCTPRDPRLLALRHHRRVPPHQGEFGRAREAVLHGDVQPLHQRGARALAQHLGHLAHSCGGAADLWRRNPQGLRAGARDRSCLGCLLFDRRGSSALRHVEGNRAQVQGACQEVRERLLGFT